MRVCAHVRVREKKGRAHYVRGKKGKGGGPNALPPYPLTDVKMG